MTESDFNAMGYDWVRMLPTGEFAGMRRMTFTFALVVGLDDYGYRTRFCYPDYKSCVDAIIAWDGRGDPPGPWIKEKGRQGERSNPQETKQEL